MKCLSLKKFSFTPLLAVLSVLFCSCLSLLLFVSSPVSASTQPLYANGWYLYGQASYGAANTWSTSFSTNSYFTWYNGHKLRLSSQSYTASGQYINFDYSILLSIGTSTGYFSYDYPLALEACSLGGKTITLTSNSSTWTTPSNESGRSAAITGSITGTTSGTASGSLVCDWAGKNGSYFARPLVPPSDFTFRVSSATLNIDSFGSQSDQTQAQQLEQMVNVNKNLAIVNQAVNNMSTNVQNSINNAADQAHEDAEKTQAAINGMIKQDQDQYDQEKAEENEREEQGKEDADQAKNLFSFELLNPFAPIFEMFNPGGCVQIPTLASWLHVDDSQVCPWFPENVRSILTPVFSISAMMLLFGFLIGWLNGGDLNGSVEVKS